MATAGVLLFKGGAGAGPRVERSEPSVEQSKLKRGFLARVRVRVTVAVAVNLPLGLGVGLPLLVHIWGLPERTGRLSGRTSGWPTGWPDIRPSRRPPAGCLAGQSATCLPS